MSKSYKSKAKVELIVNTKMLLKTSKEIKNN